MSRSGRFAHYLVLGLAVLSTVALSGCTRTLRSSVTCKGIRELKPGMNASEVVQLIGDPARRGPSVILQDGSRQGPEVWVYNSEGFFGGIRFTLEFEGSSLQKASAYYRYLLDNRSTTLYSLNPTTGAIEGSKFSDYFSCDPTKVAMQ